MSCISIIGGGALGRAFSVSFSQNIRSNNAKPTVQLFVSPKRYKMLCENNDSLKEVDVLVSKQELQKSDIILFCVASRGVLDSIKEFDSVLPRGVPIILCAKGFLFDRDSTQKSFFLQERVSSLLKKNKKDNPVGILSGPNFASEIEKGVLSSTVLAFEKEEVGQFCAKQLDHPLLRCYLSQDLIGVQVAGALKNVYALLLGIILGNFQKNQNALNEEFCDNTCDNTKAAFLTHSLHEMMSFGLFFEASQKTFYELCGIGDLVLSCYSSKSRNFSFGFAIGSQDSFDISALKNESIEGIFSVESAYYLSLEHNIEMPFLTAVFQILYDNKNIAQIIENLFKDKILDKINNVNCRYAD
jgi:glycerol-3-phosphate dehydrogenase (NAD(P)+)